MSEHGTYLDCGCYIAPGGGRSWCPTCAGGGHKDTRDDTIRSLRLENGRLRGLLSEWRTTPFFDDEGDWTKWVSEFRPRVDAALATPADGLWKEVVRALNLGRDGCYAIARECDEHDEAEDASLWRRDVAIIDELLGRKP